MGIWFTFFSRFYHQGYMGVYNYSPFFQNRPFQNSCFALQSSGKKLKIFEWRVYDFSRIYSLEASN